MRIAFPVDNEAGLESIISKVFARADKFLIIDIEEDRITDYYTIDNEAKDFSHGAGPVAIKLLLDNNVGYIAAPEVGVGTMELIREKGLKLYIVEAGEKVLNELKRIFPNIELES